jgi:hypothetical protein
MNYLLTQDKLSVYGSPTAALEMSLQGPGPMQNRDLV